MPDVLSQSSPGGRYSRQSLLPQVGHAGQARLAGARVLLVGCGALGTVIADQLVRGGVGWIRIVDRDIVELSNLQRQTLFDESDARDQTPKAIAAARRLSAINSSAQIEPVPTDLVSGNIEALTDAGGRCVDLILDGTDNAETRYLINDFAVHHGVPWVYGACVGTEGRVMGVAPDRSACLRCLFEQPPAAGELPTCSTAGVLSAASAVVASLQVVAGLQMLLGDDAALGLISVDVWTGRWKSLPTAQARRADCPCCGLRQFEYLNRPPAGDRPLCGQDAVQLRPHPARSLDLHDLARQLERSGEVSCNSIWLRYRPTSEQTVRFSLFVDGRVIVHGVSDAGRARSLYAQHVGH
jgi:adenylyltransferase/sulfurtransferase